jgi:PKHD-type hydroxylase
MPSSNYFLDSQRNNVNHLNYYFFTDAFTSEELIKIIEIGESLPKEKATTVGEDGKTREGEYRLSEISWLSDNPETEWIYKRIAEHAKIANETMWNFDIWGFQDLLQYTKYHGNGGHYDWHVDLGPGISNRKLSCVLQLSEPEEYDGGELQVNPGGNIFSVPKKMGNLVFFPSFLMHKVTPLKSGVRKSLVTWLCGANFR